MNPINQSTIVDRDVSRWRELIQKDSRTWLVTGVAGFIGSNLLETLLQLGQRVVGLDNFSTGFRHNLQLVEENVGPDHWQNFQFIEGDVRRIDDCKRAVETVDRVLHQAAIGSVPRSIADPLFTNDNNVIGTLNMLHAAQQAGVKDFVYASSSSVYGDSIQLPKIESDIGNPLSPYAVSKRVAELYSIAFANSLDFCATGLRYFNVFGARQNPDGAYAAVIPKWIDAVLNGDMITINGDGETSRDFCYIDNVVQANLLAATSPVKQAGNVFNIAAGGRCSLNELYRLVKEIAIEKQLIKHVPAPIYADFRKGDVRHSHADISRAQQGIGYSPTHDLRAGLYETISWYASQKASAPA
ncbi:SDR family oxidoreductase [Roseiconus lacunae]|uniref:SDR family oxidoreductase n=1 Tax=Roseiconus lacunae TaxID=2605694 RepID=UPI00308DA925|nr:SDR family oxidoreductase [Stieleria sp. HD01]